MGLPNRTDLLTLDHVDGARPFAQIATSSADGLDFAVGARPFWAVADAAVASNQSIATLPVITGSGAGSGPSLIASAATLAPISASGTAQTGPVGNSALTLPLVSAAGSGGGSPVLPQLLAVGHGAVGVIGGSNALGPALAAAGHALTGTRGVSVVTVPKLAGSGAGPWASWQTLPALTGGGSALTGVVGRSQAARAALTATGQALIPLQAASAQALPKIHAAGHGLTEALGASTAILARLIVAGAGLAGRVGTSTVTLPVLRATGTGAHEVIGASALILPAILAEGTQAPTVGTSYAGYALQTQRHALTTYDHLPFAALAQVDGVYLAAGPGGLFVLEGATDDSALIAASARLGITDFGDPQVKRVDMIYVNYRTDGALSLNVTTDDTATYSYPLTAHGNERLNTTRVKIGKGARGVYWQLALANVNGADFDLERLDVVPLSTTRRIA